MEELEEEIKKVEIERHDIREAKEKEAFAELQDVQEFFVLTDWMSNGKMGYGLGWLADFKKAQEAAKREGSMLLSIPRERVFGFNRDWSYILHSIKGTRDRSLDEIDMKRGRLYWKQDEEAMKILSEFPILYRDADFYYYSSFEHARASGKHPITAHCLEDFDHDHYYQIYQNCKF